MPRSHKRKRPPRVQAEIPDEKVEIVSAPEDDGEPELDTEELQRQDEIGDANHRVKAEAEIWDTFREEFHEAVEQLPLYLHRSYSLLRELDEQVTGNYNQIYPTLQRYILLRRSLAGQDQQDPTNANNVVVVKEQSTPPPESEVKPGSDAGGDSKSSLEPPETHTDAAPSTSRELLRHLGWLMDEVVRGSQEKVGLAQATYDSIDRHIRLLEQSIREQEMSISFGLRQGTHPSLLPDLAAPSRWARATRVTHSPIPGLSDEDITAPPGISAGSEVTIGMASGSNDAPRGASASSSAKKSKKGKKRKTDKAVPEAEAAPAPAAVAVSSSRSLKLKVPPLNVTVQGDAAADPNEPKYCYCNRVSFGNMVACDYPQCKREWFHLDCVGLTELPQSRTWYCKDCEPLVRKGDLWGPRRRGR